MTYAERVAELEAEGLTTSDAQAVADAEKLKGRVFDFDPQHPNDDQLRMRALVRGEITRGAAPGIATNQTIRELMGK